MALTKILKSVDYMIFRQVHEAIPHSSSDLKNKILDHF